MNDWVRWVYVIAGFVMMVIGLRNFGDLAGQGLFGIGLVILITFGRGSLD